MTKEEARVYADELRSIPKQRYELIICPSAVFLPYYEVGSYHLGAQDVSRFQEGAYTGEISAKSLASLGVKYALVGHSERRAYFEENERVCIRKIENALAAGIQVVYFVGETNEEKLNGKTNQVIERQIARVLNEFKREDLKNVIIAYEPIWAVGTGRTPEVREVEDTICFIKRIMEEYYELDTDVLYGGSVNAENILTFAKSPVIDGIIIGLASSNTTVLHRLVDTLA